MRGKGAVIGGHVADEGLRQDQARVHGQGVQERLEQGTGGARRPYPVHLSLGRAVEEVLRAHVRAYPAAASFGHQDCGVADALALQVVEVLAYQAFDAPLQRTFQGGGDPAAARLAKGTGQVRGVQGKRAGAIGDRFQGGQPQGLLIEMAAVAQSAEQLVAPDAQPGGIGQRRDQTGGVGQNGQGGGLSPGELFGRLAEVAQRGGPVADDVAAVRGVVQVQAEDLLLVVAQLRAQGLTHLQEFVDQGTRLGVRQPDHLHGEGAGAADHAAGGEVLPQGPSQR